MLAKIEYAKYIPQLEIHSKQKELEQMWELITKDPEWAVTLRRQKIVKGQHLNSTMLTDTSEHIYV